MKQKMKGISFIRLIGNHILSCAILGVNCTRLNCTAKPKLHSKACDYLNSTHCSEDCKIVYTRHSGVQFHCHSRYNS